MINALQEGVSQKEFLMKNLYKVLGIIALIAVIGFSVVSCKDKDEGDDGDDSSTTLTVGSTSGQLTITGLGAYNGNYVAAMGSTDDDELIAAASVNSNWTGTGVRISGGQAVLKVWKATGDTSIGNFTGNGEAGFEVAIFNTSTVHFDDDSGIIAFGYVYPVNFTNGVGTGAFELDDE
jgi:hypothetical protein